MIFLGITWWFPKCSCNQHAHFASPPGGEIQLGGVNPQESQGVFSWKIAMVKPPDHGKAYSAYSPYPPNLTSASCPGNGLVVGL